MRLVFLSLLLGTAACAGGGSEPGGPGDEDASLVECTEPRPQMCTQHYDPVCGLRDTGIRCVTTPCDSTEWREFSNACMACADAEVYGHKPGACPAPGE